MPEVITEMESRHSPRNDEKVSLLTLDNLDGRTLAVRRIKELETQIMTDMGDDLTEAQRSLLRRAVVLSALLDDQEARWVDGTPFELNEYLSATNVLRRLLSTLGLERKPKPADGMLLG